MFSLYLCFRSLVGFFFTSKEGHRYLMDTMDPVHYKMCTENETKKSGGEKKTKKQKTPK